MNGEPPAALVWAADARRAIEQETIYLRARLLARAEALVRDAGRREVALADVEQARRMSGHAPAAPQAPVPEPDWPVTFGAYQVLDPTAPVAICTLASEALVGELVARRPDGVAVVGRLFTENFGVEKVVTNLVTNPAIRVLLLCGTESRHQVGGTLLALHQHGVDADGRVAGSPSPIPFVRSLSPEAVRLYQQKLELVDLRGEGDVEAIAHAAGAQAARQLPPWPERWAAPVPVVRLGAGGPSGGMAGRFSPDPTGLFLIGIGPSGRTIHAEHYTRDGLLDRRVIGETADGIARQLALDGLLGDVGHALYVGRELQKAEVALRLGLQYEQDRALDLPESG